MRNFLITVGFTAFFVIMAFVGMSIGKMITGRAMKTGCKNLPKNKKSNSCDYKCPSCDGKNSCSK